MCSPPSTGIMVPLIHAASSLDNKYTTLATSSGNVNLLKGLRNKECFFISSLPGIIRRDAVSVTPAWIQFALIPKGAYSNAIFLVMASKVTFAKVTLEAITRNIALEYAPFGIRANCIQAGVTDTASLRMIPGSDEIKKHSLLRNPFNRLTLPEDVANVVYLLSKDEAAWINGTIIPVDGGEHIS